MCLYNFGSVLRALSICWRLERILGLVPVQTAGEAGGPGMLQRGWSHPARREGVGFESLSPVPPSAPWGQFSPDRCTIYGIFHSGVYFTQDLSGPPQLQPTSHGSFAGNGPLQKPNKSFFSHQLQEAERGGEVREAAFPHLFIFAKEEKNVT